MSKNEVPYKPLGERLKSLRLKRNASALEVSSAVEIDEANLQRIEDGQERPSEDILMLLINYFGMQDDEAAGVWQLAGYEAPKDEFDESIEDEKQAFIQDAMKNGHATVMMMAIDPRIIYSDGVDITANRQGVVLSFTQGAPSGDNGRMPVARIGVSYDQAQALLEVLHQTMAQAKLMRSPKKLPPPDNGEPQSHEK